MIICAMQNRASELLEITKALHKARYYIMGHSNLHIVTDHKPLEKFLENEDVKKEENRRLMNLRRKCENNNFCITYKSGAVNTADPLSRREAPAIGTRHPANIESGDKNKKIATILRIFASQDREQSDFEREISKEDELWSAEARASVNRIYSSTDTEDWHRDCSCTCTTACSYSYTDDDAELEKTCKCKALKCGISVQEERSRGGQTAEAKSARTGIQITLSEIGAYTDEDGPLSSLRGHITEGRTSDVEKILLQLKTPKIGIRQLENGILKITAIKPIHLTVMEGAVLVNNRAWIPQLLIADILTVLHTESHKCVTRMFKKASQSIYFIGMKEKFEDHVKSCLGCQDTRQMKPALSKTPTEQGRYPF